MCPPGCHHNGTGCTVTHYGKDCIVQSKDFGLANLNVSEEKI